MTYVPENFTVWAEIPVTDMEKSMAFYNAVTDAGLELDTSGPNPMAMFKPLDTGNGVAGHLYPGKPAGDGTGPTIHLAAPGTAEDTMKRVEAAGGKVVSPVIEIPAGRFFYALDLDGNSVGFFETR
ncbi:VOC family protein [Mameliella sediminis]|uniref:VOC family protein n=1 Tax=Mameliella sediminis TaxID=2836866 RepID=UPI001C466ED1|nr:VOC family protein [Mameliella sediminis]MBY6116439.1 VOC family protein [Antarctobacter heliothermus]MBY6145535.1 VOC family protein [Mameliella alba]MBV7393741.1 VOC family protein [Mameliella sediminis]MBY6160859.1 VOC family protein [Mameliella alba]MBY6169329.1 VOC family protein [Mameliella alba]